MSAKHQMELAEKPFGRIMLHLICLNSDFRFIWHLSGIIRELRRKA